MLKVDGIEVGLNGEANLLEVIRKAGINLPTFCYHSELSVYGACRMCMVEANGRLVPACSTPPADGMTVLTNTAKLRNYRRMIVELLLANHDKDCTTCERNGSCKLQTLAYQLGVDKSRFVPTIKNRPVDESSPSVVRDPNKCILCGDCVRVCEEVQGLGVLDFQYRGASATVGPAFGKPIAEVDCAGCGQCVQACPTGALSVKNDIPRVWDAISDPDAYTVIQVAPAVRVALGEEFNLGYGEAVAGKIASALKRLGFKKVFDTVFTADLCAVEETHEFLGRVKAGGPFPLLTSCCPAWVKTLETHHSDFLENVSSCMSPQQMMGSLIKEYLPLDEGVDRNKVVVVSAMPCTAKKFEITRQQFEEKKPVDIVITTHELARMIKQAGIVFDDLPEDSFDDPFGVITGGGLIFGATGGVAEAVLRTAAVMLKDPEAAKRIEFKEVRGLDGIKEAELEIAGIGLKLAVVHGLGNVKTILDRIRKGEAFYHVIEVMACPGGCAGGGGQPVPEDLSVKKARIQGLYNADDTMELRIPTENPAVKEVYERWLKEPGSHEAHRTLHTSYGPRRRIFDETIAMMPAAVPQKQVDVEVCVGTGCYLRGSYDVLSKLTESIATNPDLIGKVNLKATFCLEHCDRGVSMRFGGKKVVTGVTPDNALETLQTELSEAKAEAKQ